LHLSMVKKKAMDRAVAPIYKMACESSDIKSPHSFFAPVTASNEFNESIRIICIKIDDLHWSQQDKVFRILEILTSW
jgi:hypothetical protein